MDQLKKDKAIQCKKHPEFTVSALDITLKTNNVLKCQECILEDDGQTKDYISLRSIQACDDDQIFINWPPVNDINLLKEIKRSIEIEDQNLEEIEQNFQAFISEILEKLQLKKKMIIQQIVQRKEDKEEMLKLYNQISDKQTFKKLVNLNNNRQLQKQIQNLEEFIKNAVSQKNQYSNLLQQQISKIQGVQNFQSEQLFKLKESIIKQVDELQTFQQDKQQQDTNLFEKGATSEDKYSKQIQILEFREQNTISLIQNKDIWGHSMMFFKLNINKDNNYIIRFKFNKIFSNVIIGLVEQNLIKENTDNLLTKYNGQKVKFKYFNKSYEQKLVQMLIDVKNQIVEFQDYPQKKFTDKLNGTHNLDPISTFYLTIIFDSSWTNIKHATTHEQHLDLIYFEEKKN
ncbi:hypothetical protein ABPG74_008187 [Tetrahymena malaccensis]